MLKAQEQQGSSFKSEQKKTLDGECVCVCVCAYTVQQGLLTFLNPIDLNYLLQKVFTLTSVLKKILTCFGSTYICESAFSPSEY